jgi:hypothetical protein
MLYDVLYLVHDMAELVEESLHLPVQQQRRPPLLRLREVAHHSSDRQLARALRELTRRLQSEASSVAVLAVARVL